MVGANAVLTKIQAAGTIDRYGDTVTDGPLAWQGRVTGFLKRARATHRDSNDSQVNVKTDQLILMASTVARLLDQAGPDWAAGVLTIEDQRTISRTVRTFRIVGSENRAGGLTVDSVRLDLQET